MKGRRLLYDFTIYEGKRETTFRQEEFLNEQEYQEYLDEVATQQANANNGLFTYKVKAETKEIINEEIEDISDKNFTCDVCHDKFTRIVHSLNTENPIDVCFKCGMDSVAMQNSIADIKLGGIPMEVHEIDGHQVYESK